MSPQSHTAKILEEAKQLSEAVRQCEAARTLAETNATYWREQYEALLAAQGDDPDALGDEEARLELKVAKKELQAALELIESIRLTTDFDRRESSLQIKEDIRWKIVLFIREHPSLHKGWKMLIPKYEARFARQLGLKK